MSTRNVGAAFAPLLSIQDIDQRAIVMVAIGLPMQIDGCLSCASRTVERTLAAGIPLSNCALNAKWHAHFGVENGKFRAPSDDRSIR